MNIDMRLSEALEKIREKNYDEALSILDEIIEANPDFGEAYFWKAKCYESVIKGEINKLLKRKECKEEDFKWVKDDYRLKEALDAYEKALNLLPEDKNVLKNFIEFFKSVNFIMIPVNDYGCYSVSATGLDWRILDRALEKWLENNPDDVEIWFERAGNINTTFYFFGSLLSKEYKEKYLEGVDYKELMGRYYTKVIDIIESTYESVEISYGYDEDTLTKVIKYPDKMIKEHRELYTHALSALYDISGERGDLVSFLHYCCKRIWVSADRSDEIKGAIEALLLYFDRRPEKRDEISEKIKERFDDLLRKRGLSMEEFEREILQNTLVTSCFHKLKSFIRTKLENKYGKNWWMEAVPEDVKRKAEKRKFNSEKRYPDKPKQHEFDYLDIRDFYKIIKNNWKIFENNLGSLEFVKSQIIDPLAHLRNIVKHDSRLLEDHDIKELEVILERIERTMA